MRCGVWDETLAPLCLIKGKPLTADYAWKLWIYTNYDCNLSCSYCVAESHPRAQRRGLGLEQVARLVDEAAALDFESVYFTGGEPFLLPGIYAMLDYAARRMRTTVLTNGMLFNARRLEQLRAVAHPNLVVQVSLDGAQPEQHDRYRGAGSWAGAVAGIRALKSSGFSVRLATTITDDNAAHLDELRSFRETLGIAEADHILRPLAQRGFSQGGVTVTRESLLPEITVNSEGAYWHPLTTDDDMRISREIFPLANVVEQVRVQVQAGLNLPEPESGSTPKPFR